MNATDCCAKCRLWERDDHLWSPWSDMPTGVNADPYGECQQPAGVRLDAKADDDYGLAARLMTLPDFCCRGFIPRD